MHRCQRSWLPSFAFPHEGGSSNSLAQSDPLDVSSLSCQVITCIPAITARPSLLPASSPTSLSAHLAVRFPPKGGAIRGSHVPQRVVRWVRCLLLTEKSCWLRNRKTKERFTDFQYLLVQAYQPLSLVYFHGLYRRFTCVHHTHCLALTRTRFPGGELSHDDSPAHPCCFGTLSR